MNGYSGVYTALATPFRDGKIDYDALQKIIDYNIENRVSGLVPCGTTGESPTLDHKEHIEVIRKTIDFAAGRVPIIAGTGSNSTKEAIEMSVEAVKAGADGLLLVTPYYNKPTQKGLIEHFKAIAKEVPQAKIVLYNIPGRTSVQMTIETIVELSFVENIVSIKEATGSLSFMIDVIEKTDDSFTLLSGDDNLLLPVLSIGGKGVISVVSNIFPKEVVELIQTFEAGAIEKAKEQFYRLLPVCRAMFLETNPIPVKRALEILGMAQAEVRLPLTPLSEPNTRKLKSILQTFREAGR